MNFEPAEPPTDQPLRLPIQDIYRFDDRRILAGPDRVGHAQSRRPPGFRADQQSQHCQDD